MESSLAQMEAVSFLFCFYTIKRFSVQQDYGRLKKRKPFAPKNFGTLFELCTKVNN